MVGAMLARFMTRNPFLGPVLAAGFLSTVGDAIAQRLVEKNEQHDFRRNFRLASYGFFVIGPASCLWFRALEKIVVIGGPLAISVQKVLLDQLVFSPIFLGVFFLYNGLMEGHTYPGILRKFELGYWEAFTACLKVWPAVQLINFFLVPLHFRVVFVNLVALGWTAFLSTLNSRASLEAKSEFVKIPAVEDFEQE